MESAASSKVANRVAASDDCLGDFTAAWKDELCEELAEGEARIRLGELVELYCLVAKPLPGKRADVHGGLGDMGT